jgi:hypothetical protein
MTTASPPRANHTGDAQAVLATGLNHSGMIER